MIAPSLNHDLVQLAQLINVSDKTLLVSGKSHTTFSEHWGSRDKPHIQTSCINKVGKKNTVF